MTVSKKKIQCSRFIMLYSFVSWHSYTVKTFLLFLSTTVNINVEGSRPNCKTGRVSFLRYIQISSGGESCGDSGFFWSKSGKFRKMLSKDQVQMAASNQQAAGIFSTAAECNRCHPLDCVCVCMCACMCMCVLQLELCVYCTKYL